MKFTNFGTVCSKRCPLPPTPDFQFGLFPLTLKTRIQFLHKTLQPMMYHPIKFGCKKISSSVDMAETVIFAYIWTFTVTLTMKIQTNLLARHSGPWWCITIPSWLQTVKQMRRFHPDEHLLEFWTFPVTLTLTTTLQSNLFTRQWCAIKPSTDAKGSAVQKVYQKVKFWSNYSSLWPWPWSQQTNLFGRQSQNLAHDDASLYQVW